MNYITIFCDEWKPTKTTQYKNQIKELKEKINELVYYSGEILLLLGFEDGTDDYYYIAADNNGIIHYISFCCGFEYCLKDMMTPREYKKIKKTFINWMKYQRDWRKNFDKRVYLAQTNNHIKIDQYICNGIPIIKTYVYDINKFKNTTLSVETKKMLNTQLVDLILHKFGYHKILNAKPLINEIDEINYNQNDILPTNSIIVGYCSVCKGQYKVKECKWKDNFCSWYLTTNKTTQKMLKWFYKFCYCYKRINKGK